MKTCLFGVTVGVGFILKMRKQRQVQISGEEEHVEFPLLAKQVEAPSVAIWGINVSVTYVLSQSVEALPLLFAFCYLLFLHTAVAWGNTSDICLGPSTIKVNSICLVSGS